MRKSKFCINEVADRNPIFVAECSFRMQLLKLLLVAISGPSFCLQNLSNHYMAEEGGKEGVDHVPLNEGAVEND
jgi:hypothetical protein